MGWSRPKTLRLIRFGGSNFGIDMKMGSSGERFKNENSFVPNTKHEAGPEEALQDIFHFLGSVAFFEYQRISLAVRVSNEIAQEESDCFFLGGTWLKREETERNGEFCVLQACDYGEIDWRKRTCFYENNINRFRIFSQSCFVHRFEAIELEDLWRASFHGGFLWKLRFRQEDGASMGDLSGIRDLLHSS